MRSADQLPQAESKDIPESPFSLTWERVWEPNYSTPKNGAHGVTRQERKRTITYINTSAHMPETDLQALMEAKPHEDPATSKESSAALRERIADAIDALPERLRWIFEARYYRGLSVREVGRELGLSKSYVDRLYNQAVKELGRLLADLMDDK